MLVEVIVYPIFEHSEIEVLCFSICTIAEGNGLLDVQAARHILIDEHDLCSRTRGTCCSMGIVVHFTVSRRCTHISIACRQAGFRYGISHALRKASNGEYLILNQLRGISDFLAITISFRIHWLAGARIPVQGIFARIQIFTFNFSSEGEELRCRILGVAIILHLLLQG